MHRLREITGPLVVFAALAAGCSSSSVDVSSIPQLPTVVTADIREILNTSDRPVVLNVWASWCIPCRSEAPLLDVAANAFNTEVRFVGLNVSDTQDGARRFIAEFLADAPIEHYADPRGAITAQLGGAGVPLTFFFNADGSLSELHFGVIDERTLALQLDELITDAG